MCARIGVWTCWLRPAFVQHGLLPIRRHRLPLYCNRRLVVHHCTMRRSLGRFQALPTDTSVHSAAFLLCIVTRPEMLTLCELLLAAIAGTFAGAGLVDERL